MFTPEQLRIKPGRRIILSTIKGDYAENFQLHEIANNRFALYSIDSLEQAIKEAKKEFAPGVYHYGKNGLTDWYIDNYMLHQKSLLPDEILSVELQEN